VTTVGVAAVAFAEGSASGAVELDEVLDLARREFGSMPASPGALASDPADFIGGRIVAAIERDLEGERYEASLAARRYELVDPAKRHVARELEARWNAALERVAELEKRIEEKRAGLAAQPKIDRALLLQLAQDLPAVWNAPSTDTRTKQRLIHSLVKEIVFELDNDTNEAVLLIHWVGGRHSELRVGRVKCGRRPTDATPTAVQALRKLAGHWSDRDLAVSLNRMLCRTSDGETWTTVRVRDMRERLGLPEYDPAKSDGKYISLGKAAEQLGICRGSAQMLVGKKILPATQIMKGAPYLVPIEALSSEAVRIGVQTVIDRRPKHYEDYQYDKVIRLPGI